MKKNYIHLSRSEMHFPTKDIEIMDVFYIDINCLMATPVNSFVILICGSTRFEITSFYMNIRHILVREDIG